MEGPVLEQNIRTLLERTRLPLLQLAQQAEIPVDLLQAARQGSLQGWTTSMVERLAITSRVDPAAVWSDEPLEAVPALHFLRGLLRDFHPDDLVPMETAIERGASLRAMTELLGHPVGWASFGPELPREPAWKHGYALAQQVRDFLDCPDVPIVDMHSLLGERFAVYVVYRPLRTARLFAATLSSNSARAVVVNSELCTDAPVVRRTLAHELCHVLFDSTHGAAILEIDTDDGSGQDAKEQRAGAFAAELLVPRAGIERHLGVPTSTRDLDVALHYVSEISRVFGAPRKLVIHHLKNHKWMDSATERSALSSLRSSDIDAELPSFGSPDPTVDWLERRVEEAVQAELITSGRAVELLRT
jgi:Zn-dependent peptidase ImmA (M78 family)